MKIVLAFLMLLLLWSSTFCRDIMEFPLWGSTWVVAQGVNKRIYPSVLPYRPSKIAIIKFVKANDLQTSYVDLWWANFDHNQWASTYEVLDHTRKSSKKSPKRVFADFWKRSDSGFTLKYVPVNDSVFTSHDAVLDAFTKDFDSAEVQQGTYLRKYFRYSVTDGSEKLRAELRDGTAFTRDKPVCWISRPISTQDRNEFTIGYLDASDQQYYYYRPNDTNDVVIDGQKSVSKFRTSGGGIDEYCSKNRYYKRIYDFTHRTEELGYWQMHIYPEVWFYAKDPFTGQPIFADTVKRKLPEAMALKSQSIAKIDDFNLKYWRDPYLSDSASCIISAAFEGSDKRMAGNTFIWLSGSQVGSKLSYEHSPSKMYNVNVLGLDKAILSLYSENEEQEKFAQTLYTRCGNVWEQIDKVNGEILFPITQRKNGKIKRDWNVDDGIFMYNGCPCTREAQLGGLTKAQLREFIYQPVPTCQSEDLTYADYFYRKVKPILTAAQDQAMIDHKLAEVKHILRLKSDLYRKAGKEKNMDEITAYFTIYRVREEKCPKTWVDAVRSMGF